MQKISLEEFTAEIESTFSNYTESNDIDRISIKTWVIQALRKFGKNICEKNEAVVELRNSRALLPENFKSLTFAVKVKTLPFTEEETRQAVNEKVRIENPAIWDSLTQDYVVDYCNTKIVKEQTYLYEDKKEFFGYELLSLSPNINKETIDAKCFNLHPVMSEKEHQISIVGRTLNANFKEGFIFIRYNSLPEVDGDISIPIFTTGELHDYIENNVKWKIAESLMANNKNAQGLSQLYSTWKQQDKPMLHAAQTEAKMSGFSKDWDRKFYKQRLFNRRLLGI